MCNVKQWSFLINTLYTDSQPIEVLEAEMLNGQKMQGPRIAKQVHFLLKQQHKEHEWVHNNM